MSEYQYYEFQAIDRPLSREERAEIGKLSSRTTPTATTAIFSYSYGDFRGDPETVLTSYFDAMLYLTSWGNRRLAFRFPAAVVDVEAMRVYAADDLIEVKQVGDFVILDLCPEEEEPEGGWIEGEGWLAEMLSLRADIMAGDYRALYLVWLCGVGCWIVEEEAVEPPIPNGLQNLDAAHEALISFFQIDPNLVATAAAESAPMSEVHEPGFRAAIAQLPESEKDDFLRRLVAGEPGLQMALQRRLTGTAGHGGQNQRPGSRTAEELRELAEESGERKKAAEKAEKEKARHSKLVKVAKNSEALWEEAYALIHKRHPKYYTAAVEILQDLRDAADLGDGRPTFDQRLSRLRLEFKSLVNLQGQLEQAGMG